MDHDPHLPFADDADRFAERLKALADPVRLRLIGQLLSEPTRELCTCALAPLVGLGEPTVSHHLKRLAEAGLVTKERRGVNVYYRALPEAIAAIGAQLQTRPISHT
ncbi:MAG: metalloregulator ArsR/SmtB family transcription factor [Nitriliruptoraceae bacterium]